MSDPYEKDGALLEGADGNPATSCCEWRVVCDHTYGLRLDDVYAGNGPGPACTDGATTSPGGCTEVTWVFLAGIDPGPPPTPIYTQCNNFGGPGLTVWDKATYDAFIAAGGTLGACHDNGDGTYRKVSLAQGPMTHCDALAWAAANPTACASLMAPMKFRPLTGEWKPCRECGKAK